MGKSYRGFLSRSPSIDRSLKTCTEKDIELYWIISNSMQQQKTTSNEEKGFSHFQINSSMEVDFPPKMQKQENSLKLFLISKDYSTTGF